MNAGFNLAIWASVETRTPLSAVTKSLPLGTFTGIMSVRYPFSAACDARVWDLLAKSSCSSLLTPNVAASLSAECPIVSLVENSAMAGSSGAKKSGLMEASRPSLAPSVLALVLFSINWRIFLEWRMGTSDMNSTPPAMATSYTPALMSPAQVVMAWLDEMQAMVTVWAGMRSEKPAPRAASRARLLVFTSWMTFPVQMYSTMFLSMPVLLTRPIRAIRSRSWGIKLL